MDRTFTINQVAQAVGLTTKTIRYYESIEIIPPAKRKNNKYRNYSNLDIARLRLVKQMRALDLSLNEIKPLVEHCVEGKCDELKSSLISHLPKYIASIETRMIELQQLKQQLKSLNTSLTDNADIKSKNSNSCCSVIDDMEQMNNERITS